MSLFERQHPATLRDPSFASMMSAGDPWNLNFPLFQFSPRDPFSWNSAFQGVCVLGENGAAKSTGSAAWLLLAYWALGAGGLCNCVKPGDRAQIEQYAQMLGKSDTLLIVSPANGWRCNLLRYVQKMPGIEGSKVEYLTSFLMTIAEAADRDSKGGGGEHKFFQLALCEILRNAIEICIAARGEATMSLLNEVITSAPRNHTDVQSAEWQAGSRCYQLIEEADGKERTHREQSDFELAARYFLSKVPDMPDDTRGSIMATYGVMADVLLRGQMADLFDSETTFVPEVSHFGAVIVLDLPTKIYGQAGLIVQAAFTYAWQRSAEQRDVKSNPRPLFWFADEAHEIVGKYTPTFLATARSARVASVLISQNIPNYQMSMGGEGGRHSVAALLANTGTKIFHSNGDPETNRWASDVISDDIQTRTNYHANRGSDGHGSGGGGESVGKKVLPAVFTTLKKGGEQNGFMTDAIVYQTGASFAVNDGEPWLRCTFPQQIPGVTVSRDKRC